MAYLLPEPPIAGPALHEPAAPAMPNEPESRAAGRRLLLAGRAASGRPYDRGRVHTIGSGRRRAPDSAW
jgi:hypothetical protein